LEVLQWARANGCPWSDWMCDYAAQRGNLEVLKWARSEGFAGWSLLCFHAVRGGHLEVLKWGRANGFPWSEETQNLAREKLGYFESL